MTTATEFKVGQTVSIPRLPNYGKGIIYRVDPNCPKDGYKYYIQFSDKIGKRVFPADLLQIEAVPVKTSKRWVDLNEEESIEEPFIPDDSPSLQDSFGEMPSYAN